MENSSLTSDWEFQSIHEKEDSLEKFSESRIKQLFGLKFSVSELDNKVLQMNSLDHLASFLTNEEINLLTCTKNFITDCRNEPEMQMDIKYLDKVRQQQQLITKILKEVSNLQWELEKKYSELKEKEKKKPQVRKICEKDCIIDSIQQHATCCIIY